MTNEPYRLTPTDVDDLRASVRWNLSNQALNIKGDHTRPFIILGLEDDGARNAPGWKADSLVIHTEGHRWAITPRPEVAYACLLAEAAEPGFMRRIMNPREDCQLASLSPDLAAAERARRNFEVKRAREYAEEQARLKPLPIAQPDPITVNVGSLFDD